MNRSFVYGLFSFMLAGMLTSPGNAQGTEKDYERANSIDRKLSGKVWHSDIRPAWVGKTEMLIFEDRSPEGKDFILADAVKKTKKKAFDAVKLAEALGRVTGDTVKAADLPVRNLVMADDLKSVSFEYSGAVYKCDLRIHSHQGS